MATVEAPAIQESLRGKLRERVSDEIADEAIGLLMEAMRSQKTAVGTCKTCRTNVTVTITDAKAASTAFETLMSQTEGRPGVAAQEQTDALEVARTVYDHVDAAHALSLLDAGLAHVADPPAELVQLRRELTSSL